MSKPKKDDDSKSGNYAFNVRTYADIHCDRSLNVSRNEGEDDGFECYIGELVAAIQVPLTTSSAISSAAACSTFSAFASDASSRRNAQHVGEGINDWDFTQFQHVIVGVAGVPNPPLPQVPEDGPPANTLLTDTATFAEQLARTKKHLKPSRRTTAPLDVLANAGAKINEVSSNTPPVAIAATSTSVGPKIPNSVSVAELAARFDNAALSASKDATSVHDLHPLEVNTALGQLQEDDHHTPTQPQYLEVVHAIHAPPEPVDHPPTSPDHVAQPLSTDVDTFEVPIVKAVSRGQPKIHHAFESGGATPTRRPRSKTYQNGEQKISRPDSVSSLASEIAQPVVSSCRSRMRSHSVSPTRRLSNGLPAPEEYDQYMGNPWHSSTLIDDNASVYENDTRESQHATSQSQEEIGPHSNERRSREYSTLSEDTFASPQPDKKHGWERALRGLEGKERSSDEISRISNENVQMMAAVVDPDGRVRQEERKKRRKKSNRSRSFFGLIPKATSNSCMLDGKSVGDMEGTTLQDEAQSTIPEPSEQLLYPRVYVPGEDNGHAGSPLPRTPENPPHSGLSSTFDFASPPPIAYSSQHEDACGHEGIGLGLKINTKVDVRETQFGYFIEAGMSPDHGASTNRFTESPRRPSESPSPVKSSTFLSKMTSNTSSRGHKTSMSSEAASLRFGFDKLPFAFITPSRRGTADTEEPPATPIHDPASPYPDAADSAKKQGGVEKFFKDWFPSRKRRDEDLGRDLSATGKRKASKSKKSRKNSDIIDVISSPVPLLSENCSLVTAARARGITDPLASFRGRADSQGTEMSGTSLTPSLRAGAEQAFTVSLATLQEQESLNDYGDILDQLGNDIESVSIRSDTCNSVKERLD